MMNEDKYWDIYSEAVKIYTDGEKTEGNQYNDMQKYLLDQVKARYITMDQKCMIASSVIKDSLMMEECE